MAHPHTISRQRPDTAAASGRAVAGARMLPRALVTLAVAAMLLRVFLALDDRGVTSDESLYLSEAVSITDGRIEYASGEPIVHRPPLYPAMLAPVMAATGNDVDAARIVPIMCALGALAALFWLASLLFGREAAALAVAIAAVAEVPSRLAGGFFVDVPAAMWLMASAAALLVAHRRDDAPSHAIKWNAAAGALMGLSFLTKETAILWLPLPVAFALIDPSAQPKRGIALFALAFGALAAPWFTWVAWHTGSPFKLDGLAFGSVAVAGALAAAVAMRAPWPRGRAADGIAIALMVAWGALMLAVLESRPEPHTMEYWRSVPTWTARVFAPNVATWLLVGPAWGWLACRYVRGDRTLAMPLLLAGFGAPLYLYVANMGWEPRQVAALVYVSYAVLAWAIADVTARLAARWRWTDAARLSVAGGAAVACGLIAVATGGWSLREAEAGAAADWRSADEQAIAGWLRELPPASVVLSSRLYSAQLYVDTDGALPIRQLPTLGVAIGDDGAVRPFGTMFRYEDAEADLDAAPTWIGLRAHADGAYSVGLAEEDLLTTIREAGASYVLVSGDDGGFSSLAYLPYFSANPGFHLRESDAEGDIRANLYAVDASRLAPQSPPLMLTTGDLAPLLAHPRAGDAAFWRGLAPHGVLLDGQLLDAEDMASLSR